MLAIIYINMLKSRYDVDWKVNLEKVGGWREGHAHAGLPHTNNSQYIISYGFIRTWVNTYES